MMIWPFKKRSGPSEQVFAVYNAIVAQSRQEKFYAAWGIPDTVTGRFDMICLHMCAVLRRLRADAECRDFAQDLFDLFFGDMDRSLRELGVNDVVVPKRIEQMGTMFYGLLEKFTEAADAGDEPGLAEVIDRNLFDEANPEGSAHLAGYMLDIVRRLDAEPSGAIAEGRVAAFGAEHEPS